MGLLVLILRDCPFKMTSFVSKDAVNTPETQRDGPNKMGSPVLFVITIQYAALDPSEHPD